MQLAVGLLGGLGGTGAAAAGAGVAAAGTGISAASILSGVATIGGVLSTIGAGKAQANAYKDQAFHAELEGKNEQAQGVQRNTQMKRELMRVLGENTVAAAAAGLDLGQGIASDQAVNAKTQAAQEITIDRATADARRAMYKARAAGYRRMAKEAKSASVFSAISSVVQG